MKKKLVVGFDRTLPEDQATREALEEWQEYLDRNDWQGVGLPVTEILRSPERDALDEYAIQVTGDVDGDQ